MHADDAFYKLAALGWRQGEALLVGAPPAAASARYLAALAFLVPKCGGAPLPAEVAADAARAAARLASDVKALGLDGAAVAAGAPPAAAARLLDSLCDRALVCLDRERDDGRRCEQECGSRAVTGVGVSGRAASFFCCCFNPDDHHHLHWTGLRRLRPPHRQTGHVGVGVLFLFFFVLLPRPRRRQDGRPRPEEQHASFALAGALRRTAPAAVDLASGELDPQGRGRLRRCCVSREWRRRRRRSRRRRREEGDN